MNLDGHNSRRLFATYAWCVLLYNLPVVLWGAYVRISFSGDGCGANWPTCNGQFLPQKMSVPMAIEYTHRFMTGLDTAAVVLLLAWAFLAFPKHHAVRRHTVISFVFLLIEALLGAGLVLFRLVAKDQSAGRVWYLSAHMTNTMLLLAALTITAWVASRGVPRIPVRAVPGRLFGALAIVIFVSITGTITALGDTLFPATSLAAGMQQDFAKVSSLLLRLRVIHPLLAVAGTVYILWVASSLLRRAQKGSSVAKACAVVIAAVVLQLAAGMLNLALLAPLPMQLIHLLVADLVWISLVWLTLERVTALMSVYPTNTDLLSMAAS